jgi:hypothetical protein
MTDCSAKTAPTVTRRLSIPPHKIFWRTVLPVAVKRCPNALMQDIGAGVGKWLDQRVGIAGSGTNEYLEFE